MMVMMTKITGWKKKREGRMFSRKGEKEIVAQLQKYQIDSNSMTRTDILGGIEKRASQSITVVCKIQQHNNK